MLEQSEDGEQRSRQESGRNRDRKHIFFTSSYLLVTSLELTLCEPQVKNSNRKHLQQKPHLKNSKGFTMLICQCYI